jgi:hypothetical protein
MKSMGKVAHGLGWFRERLLIEGIEKGRHASRVR